ncbi:oligosaccharide flippase family protein [Colwellia demingiae]|uniref:Oligosaccharide flippase family protein n=1 Tax=Colwellia demingiae TaxID=89401 RepID=A0A5C6QTS3_9GAMM|nr:oligosaccharide flippase family protein [Colwellia demingiae]TWX71928.1 oligosaccharide flippase family protein [Colwellia demingiae]
MLNLLKGKLDSGTREFFRHGKNYLTASVFIRGLSVISIPVMTRLLTPSEFGLIAVFLSIVTTLSIIYGLGTQTTVGRYFFETNDDFGDFLGSNFLYLWGVGFILSLTTYAYKIEISELLDLPLPMLVFAIVIAFTSATYATVEAYLQVTKQSFLFTRISMFRGIFSLVITITITYYLNEHRYLGTVYSMLLFSCIFFFYSLYLVRNIVGFDFSWNHIKYSFLLGGPIILHLLSSHIINTFDQLMINKMVGAKETGFYSFAYKVGMIFQMIVISLTQSWNPIFFESLKHKNYDNIDVISIRFSFIISALALIIVMFTPQISQILAPEAYSEAISIIPVIIIGFMFQFLYVLYIGYAFYAKKTATIALITLLCGVFNILMNYIFIPIYGYTIASWTTLATFLLFFIAHYINVRLFIKPERVMAFKGVVLPVLISMLLILAYSVV